MIIQKDSPRMSRPLLIWGIKVLKIADDKNTCDLGATLCYSKAVRGKQIHKSVIRHFLTCFCRFAMSLVFMSLTLS